MSEFQGFEQTREYRFREWLRYTRSRPYACQPLMKNFWQCFDYFHYNKNIDETEAKTTCLEKFNYEQCFNEHKDILFENLKNKVEIIMPDIPGGGEEEEE